MREGAVAGQRVRLYELACRTFFAESQVFHLHHADDRVVVIGLQHVYLFRPDAGHAPEFIFVQCPAATDLYRIVRERIVAFDRRENMGVRQALRFGIVLAHDEISFGARAGHHAVEQHDGIGDHARIHILFERQWRLHQRVGILQRIGALRHANLSEVFPLRAAGFHMVAGYQRETAVGAARAVGIRCILRKTAERCQHRAKRVDMIRVAGDARHDVGIAGLHRSCSAAQRDHARRATGRYMVQPARCQSEMLRDAGRRVGKQSE